jgi:hypothetical protein
MTRTIQNPQVIVRRAFFEHAAELYGTSVSPAELDAVDDLGDLAAVAAIFPWLGDAERQEALWALGHFGD